MAIPETYQGHITASRSCIITYSAPGGTHPNTGYGPVRQVSPNQRTILRTLYLASKVFLSSFRACLFSRSKRNPPPPPFPLHELYLTPIQIYYTAIERCIQDSPADTCPAKNSDKFPCFLQSKIGNKAKNQLKSKKWINKKPP